MLYLYIIYKYVNAAICTASYSACLLIVYIRRRIVIVCVPRSIIKRKKRRDFSSRPCNATTTAGRAIVVFLYNIYIILYYRCISVLYLYIVYYLNYYYIIYVRRCLSLVADRKPPPFTLYILSLCI